MTMHQWARQIARGAAVVQILIGLLVGFAWLTQRSNLTILVTGSNPMVFNTALSFVLTGTAVLLLSFRRPAIAAPLALVVLGIAVATLTEFLFGLDLQIDSLFLRGLHSASAAFAERMAPNTATALVIAAAAILVVSSSRHVASTSIAAVLGTLTLAIGVTALIGYAFDLRPAYEWGWATQMAVLSAGSFTILGAGLLAEAIHRGDSPSTTRLPWLATAVGVALSLVTVIFWHVLRVILATRADAEIALHLPNAFLVLGLGTSMLLAGIVAQARDLRQRSAELERANRTIIAASDKIRDLYDHAPCGYHSLDADGVVIDINETELDWLGYSREEVIGRIRITDLFTPAGIATFRKQFPRFKETGVLRDLELDLVRKDGSILPALINATAIFDESGHFLKSRTTALDMTERKRIERERERAAEQLRILGETIEDLYEHAPCGYHSIDAEGLITRINDTELSWLGYSRNELVGRKSFSDLLASDSRERFEQQRKELARHVDIVDADYDLVRKDGTLLPASLSMISLFDPEGRLTECRATVHDVAERRRLERLLREDERRLQRLLDILQAAVVVHGPDTTIRYVNSTAERLLGLDRHQMAGKHAKDAYWQFVRDDGSPMPTTEFPVNVVLRTREPLLDYVVGFRKSVHAEPRWMLVNATPDLSEQGVLQQIVVSFVDISERRKLERELEYRTQTDMLTGLATRRHFLEMAEHEMSRLVRHGGSMSLLMIDVDHFKAVNDTHGHQAGDAVLTELGRIMQQTLRRIDIAGRFGGEEFVVLLPATDLAHALEAAERLRQTIASTEIKLDGAPALKVTVSVGVASYEAEDRNLATLIRRADEAMYVCKRSGRNCVSASSRPSGLQAGQAGGPMRAGG